MKRLLFLAFLAPLWCSAQTTVPAEAKVELAKDLAELQTMLQAAKYQVDASASRPDPLKGLTLTGIKVTGPQAVIRAGASDKAAVLAKAAEGATYTVVDKTADWYAVTLKADVGGIPTGWVNAKFGVPVAYADPNAGHTPAAAAQRDFFETLVERASAMKAKYANNPYFSISGFAVNIGVPPSMTVNVEFKKP